MLASRPQFDKLLSFMMAELGDFQVSAVSGTPAITDDDRSTPSGYKSVGCDFLLVGPTGSLIALLVKEFKRITPATAESACLALKRASDANGAQPILFAPVISGRTAEITAKHGISWMDYAGNCRLVFPCHAIYVSRSGIDNPFGKQLAKVLNVFSLKSCRVVRAMLQEPLRDWQHSELAKHPEVQISAGLMSRIKRSLIENGYALMQGGKLRLKRPDDLLRDWVQHYRRHKPQEYSFYIRGALEQVEHQVATWCEQANCQYALSRFSAAWKLAPQVRYTVASFMVSEPDFLTTGITEFKNQYGARLVDSGANVTLQISEDLSYLSRRVGDKTPATSPLQTYLDLFAMNGRGEDAATAIYDKYMKQEFAEASARAEKEYEGN